MMRRTPALLVLGLLLPLAACGGSDSSSEKTSGSGDSAAAAKGPVASGDYCLVPAEEATRIRNEGYDAAQHKTLEASNAASTWSCDYSDDLGVAMTVKVLFESSFADVCGSLTPVSGLGDEACSGTINAMQSMVVRSGERVLQIGFQDINPMRDAKAKLQELSTIGLTALDEG